MAEKEGVLFSLWVYVPLEWFDGEERRYWDIYIDFHEKWWGGPIFILGASVTISPEEFASIRQELAGYLNRKEEQIVDCYYFQEQSGKFYLSPWRPALGARASHEPPYHLYAQGRIPWAWFVLFDDNERVFYYGGWYGNIGYSTKLANAFERLKKAIDIMDRFEAENRGSSQGDPRLRRLIEVGEELKVGLLELRGWFAYHPYPPTASLVMDYSKAFEVVSPALLKGDRSSRDVWQLLLHMEAGNVDQAVECLNLMGERQKAMGPLGQ